MSVYETIKMSPLLGLQGSGGGLAYLAGLVGADKTYVDDVFSTFLFNGTGSALTIANGIDLAGEGGLVWIKDRDSGSKGHALFDTERGGAYKLQSQSNVAQSTYNNIVFNSNGFTNDTMGDNNGSGTKFASWTFRKAPGFIDVVTWNGSGSATGQVISHALGSTPGFIVIKETSGTAWWACWHRSLGGQRIFLNETSAATAANIQLYFGDGTNYVAPTNSSFTVNSNDLNQSGQTYVAYVFAHDDAQFGTGGDESIIKCGTYGLTSGFSNQTIDLGFEPQWLLIKRTDSSGSWSIIDNMRGLTDASTPRLRANLANAEQTTTPGKIVPNATGFTAIEGSGDYLIGTSSSYIYMAIRRPNKPPELATDVFAVAPGNSSNPIPAFVSNFTVDAAFLFNFNGGYDNYLLSRVTGDAYLRANTTEQQVTGTGETFDSNTGWARIYNSTYQSVMFKRAPGFMDVVTYTGNQTNADIQHNLQAVPELILIKARDLTRNWAVYNTNLNASSNYLQLQSDSGVFSNSGVFQNASNTDSIFKIASGFTTNKNSIKYVAYLFATLPGISKVGIYNGNTGYAVNVNCGFTNGARFILIKRTDSTGDWYLWDSVRGIVSGNDPYLRLNVNTTQTTNTDYVDPLSTGFTVTSSAPAALNASGGTYLFLAIA